MKKAVAVTTASIAIAVTSFAGTSQASNISRANAVQTAKEYLQTEAFSRKGLIEQLEFEHYSRSDSIYAVDHCHANWMYEAVQSAREYLQTESFSRQSL